MIERSAYGGPIVKEDKEPAANTAESIIYGGDEIRQNIGYRVVLPSPSVGMFLDRVEAFQHKNTLYRSDGSLQLFSRAILHPESKYSVLHQKLLRIVSLRRSELTAVRFTGREVDTLAEVVLNGANGIDAEGYKHYVSFEHQQIHRKRATVFLDFLHAFADAGGKLKEEHISRYASYLELTASVQNYVRDGWT